MKANISISSVCRGLYTFILTVSAILLTGCQSKELVFDHELQQFNPIPNAILIELIAPIGTAIDDEIYICGAFNGFDENDVVGKILWQMEKAEGSDKKWGIYLFPNDFVQGKSLADGFTFVSKKAGGERDIKGKPVIHQLKAELGSVNNIWAERWAAYFTDDDEKIQHNGPVVYVQDESGFEKLTLYLYGDINDLNGPWPGMNITGTETVNGIDFVYFDLGEGNEGLNETLIFSDNGTNQLNDYGPVSLESDPLYLHITADGNIEKINIDGIVGHDGAAVYVLDGMDWGMNTTLYMWGDVNDLNGGWPGMAVTGTQMFGDYNYMYFDLGKANDGLTEHLIFSNGGKDQLKDYDDYTIGEDIYFYLSKDGPVLITDPANPGDVEWFNPDAKPKEEALIDLWFYDATDTLAIVPDTEGNDSVVPLYLYAWGSGEPFGAWPGTALNTMDSTVILGLKLIHAQINGFLSDTYHLIINNNNDRQLDDYTIEASQTTNEFYLKISDEGISELNVVAKTRRK